jgi:hypothetical protein
MSSQVVKLKRTAVEGKVPNTSNIELGELAINTYDGRIFFEKDNGTATIQQVVTTNSQTTGSLNILGNVTASYFIGDGSQLTNLPNSDVSQVATVTSSFDNQSSIVVTHNFGSKNVFISVYDNSDSQIIPQSVVLTNNNTVTVGLSANHSGYVVVGKGGHIVSGTIVQEVSEVTTVTASFDNQSSISVPHNFNSRNVIVSVYDSSYSQLIPQTLTLTNQNSVDIVLSGNHSGHVVVAKGGHLVSGSAVTSYNNLTNIPSGLVSGSSQLTSSYDTRYALSGSVGGGSTDISSLNSFTSSIQTRVDGLSSQTASLATTGSNTFRGNQTISGSLIPDASGSYDLGTLNNPWRHIYVGTGSIYLVDDKAQTTKTITANTIVTTNDIASGSINLTTTLPSGIVSGSTQVEFNNINNTPLSQSANNVTISKSLVPTTSTIDLGTAEKPFRDLYLSSASLYIDGQQVLSSNASELVITTDVGQSIKLLEAGADDIILQTETGNIELKGTVELLSGKKIIDSGGTQILFGNSIGITGSISLSGTVDGVDVSQLKLDFDNFQGKSLVSGSSQVSYTELSNTPSGIVSGSSQVVLSSTNGFSAFSSSIDSRIVTEKGRVDAILTAVDADKDSFAEIVTLINSVDTTNDTAFASFVTSSNATNTTQNSRLTALESTTSSYETQGRGIVSGSSQIISILSSLNTYTGSNDTTNTTQNSRLDQLSTYTGSNDTTNTAQNSRLTTIESATGSYETKGRGIVSGSSQVSYTGLSSIPSGIVSGSSQVTLSSTTGYGSVINQAVLTTSSPTFANVTATSFVLGNGQFLRGTRTSGGLVINLLGIESGTDRTMMTITGDYVIQNGSNAALLTMNTSGGATFSGNIQLGSNTNQFIRYRTASAWDYYLSAVNDDFSLYDSQGTEFLKAVYNGGGTAKNIKFLNSLTAFNNSNVTVTGTLTENSSIRYKENIETIESGLDKIIQLRGVTYTKKDSGEKEMGLIAEEVYDVLPEVVLKNEEGEPDSVSYGRIVGVLIEGMKEQQKQIQELKLEIELLKQR